MGLSKVIGIWFIIPTTIFLTISFFVLVVASKVEEKKLKTFGLIVAVLLWIAALIALIGGPFLAYNGIKCHMMMNKMMDTPEMGDHMKGMMQYHHMKMMKEKK